MRRERAGLSRHTPVAKAMDYMLKRWDGSTRFLADGRVCLTNHAAERALRGIALGRKSWLLAGSDRGGERADLMYGLIASAKPNDVGPQACLADVLARIAGIPAPRLDDLLPWNWNAGKPKNAARPAALAGRLRLVLIDETAATTKMARPARAQPPRRALPRRDPAWPLEDDHAGRGPAPRRPHRADGPRRRDERRRLHRLCRDLGKGVERSETRPMGLHQTARRNMAIRLTERCRSGRTGRSRKPLWG